LEKKVHGSALSSAEKAYIARCLIYWRELHGWSQAQAAAELQHRGYDISREVLSHYETCKHDYDVGALIMFADVYGTTVPELINFAEIISIRKKERGQ